MNNIPKPSVGELVYDKKAELYGIVIKVTNKAWGSYCYLIEYQDGSQRRQWCKNLKIIQKL
tara:strand:+ start:897 stop:1079 length:183 start_codon:yes stop_codon:yes gene_type:complete